ncbi:MAG: TetR/AcrR family transcriptional regulator [Caulobacterales bacterium]
MSSPTPEEPPRTSRKRAQTVARLLEAAVAVIAEKGFQRASLDEIAARAGLTKGAIYSNFGSKEELFLAVAATRPVGFGASAQPGQSMKTIFRKLGEDCAATLPEARAHSAFTAEFLLYVLTHEEMRLRVAERAEARFSVAPPDGVEQYLKATGRPSYKTILLICQALSLGLFYEHALMPELFTEEVAIAAFDMLAGRPDPRS